MSAGTWGQDPVKGGEGWMSLTEMSGLLRPPTDKHASQAVTKADSTTPVVCARLAPAPP